MFYHDTELQFEVEVEESDPQFVKMLREATDGVEDELRVAHQYNEVN